MRKPCLLIAAAVAAAAATAAGCTEEPKERQLSLAEIPGIMADSTRVAHVP